MALTEISPNLQSAPPAPKQSARKKRKSSDEAEVDLDNLEVPKGTLIDCNADQIRRKITKYIDSGASKVGEFCQTLNVSQSSYRNFMSQKGREKGTGSDTFPAAWEFFKKREVAGLKMPQAKRTKTSGSGNTKSTQKAKGDPIDVSDIHLDREDRKEVPIFDTCDVVRNKIIACLKQPGATKAGLLRKIAEQFPEKPTKGLSTTSWTTFMGQGGNMRTSGSPIYYGAYVIFEKQRIKEGEKKTEKREEMEKAWGVRGVWRNSVDRLWMHDSEHLEEDGNGKVFVCGPKGKRQQI